MKIPVIPLTVAGTLIAIVLYLFNLASSEKTVFGEPRFEKLAELAGTETEVAVAPDGTRLVAIASGDLWLFNVSDGSRQRLTQTTEIESFPAWTPDGKRLTFTKGHDTFVVSANDLASSKLLKENATCMSWSGTGRQAYVRNRTLWITDAGGINDRAMVEPDEDPDVTVTQPHFSADSSQIAYIKTSLGLHGELWLADATTGTTRGLVNDRVAENPLDTGWLGDSNRILYLTNRSGAYGFWVVDLKANTLNPLTGPLNGVLPQRIGFAVANDQIFMPRLTLNSDIVLSDGSPVTQTDDTELEPAASRDGTQVAYTVQKGNKNEIWSAGIHGENPKFRVLGTQPRFSPNGFEIVYTHTDIEGRIDLRKVDIRDASSETITVAPPIDFQPDWSPDGRTITFASGQDGTMSLFSAPSTGGKRVGLNIKGYYPRYSPDGRSLVYWSQAALWIADVDGKNPRKVREDLTDPVPAGWLKGIPKTYLDPEINGGKAILSAFDVLPDGRVLTATIKSEDSAIWKVSLTYVAK